MKTRKEKIKAGLAKSAKYAENKKKRRELSRALGIPTEPLLPLPYLLEIEEIMELENEPSK